MLRSIKSTSPAEFTSDYKEGDGLQFTASD